MEAKKIVVIDGNSIAYRAFYKAPPLTAPDGTPTGVVHLFFLILLKLINKFDNHNIIVVFDAKGKNRRHKMLEAYKANRKPMPDDLRPQMDMLKQLIPLLGLPVYCVDDVEADDVINSLVKNNQDGQSFMITKDKDMFQLINDNTFIYDYSTDLVIGYEEATEKFGIPPDKILDYLALCGDTSDNIPGVPRVGAKTAVKLLNLYHSLDGVYSNIDSIKGKLNESLTINKELAYLSKQLATLIYLEEKDMVPNLQSANYELLLEKVRDLKLRTVERKIVEQQQPKKEKTSNFETDKKNIDIEPTITNTIGAMQIGEPKETKYVICLTPNVYISDGEYYRLVTPMDIININNSDKDIICFHYKNLYKQGILDNTPLTKIYDLALIAWLNFPDGSGYKALKNETDEQFIERIISTASEEIDTLKAKKLHRLYFEIELPVAKILAESEILGVNIDAGQIKKVAEELDGEIKDIEEQIYVIAGYQFNISSPKQLGELLFNNLSMKPPKKIKTGFSTNEDSLKQLLYNYEEHERLLSLILKFRELSKFRSTYTLSMLEFIDSKGRIHPEFNQTGAATGRLSSNNPNIQSIPVRSSEAKRVRQAFKASKNYTLIGFDYSQIELRILAHMANDEALIQAFNNNEDIHTKSACGIFHKSSNEITANERGIAKAVNFSILYGKTPFTLARDIRVSQKEAKTFIDNYFQSYPKIKGFIDNIIADVQVTKTTTTLLGRQRSFMGISSGNRAASEHAKRAAVNAPIQGSAADIIKKAMIDVDLLINKNKLPARLLMQIHDELIFEVLEKSAVEVEKKIKSVMENTIRLKVPLSVNSIIGSDWSLLK